MRSSSVSGFTQLLRLARRILVVKDLKIDAGFSAAVVEVLKEENMLLPDPTVMDTFGVKIFTSGPGFVLSLFSGSKEKGE